MKMSSVTGILSQQGIDVQFNLGNGKQHLSLLLQHKLWGILSLEGYNLLPAVGGPRKGEE